MPALIAATHVVNENAWLEIGIIWLLALFCGLFFWWFVKVWKFKERSDMDELAKVIPEDPRPDIQFASTYEYMQRAHFVPLLFLINIAIVGLAMAAETRGAGIACSSSVISLFMLLQLTDTLQKKSYWDGREVIAVETAPELYRIRVRSLFAQFAMSIVFIAIAAIYYPFNGLFSK